MPYIELLIRNGLAVKVERGVPRYRTAAKGTETFRYFREWEAIISERMPQLSVKRTEQELCIKAASCHGIVPLLHG